MKCKKCGADIPMENAQFCPYCGADFSQSNHPAPSSEVTSQKSSKSTKKEKSGKKPFYKDVLFWMVIILILPFVFLGVAWLVNITFVILRSAIFCYILFLSLHGFLNGAKRKNRIIMLQQNKKQTIQKKSLPARHPKISYSVDNRTS